jgi:WD40 repeat protein
MATPGVRYGQERPKWAMIWAMAFAPDGRLATACEDGTARIWDLTDPKAAPALLTGHRRRIVALAFAPDGRLVTASDDGTARIWNLNHTEATPVVLTGGYKALAFAPDGRLVAAGAIAPVPRFFGEFSELYCRLRLEFNIKMLGFLPIKGICSRFSRVFRASIDVQNEVSA